MKYVIMVGDGMADYPLDQLGGKTPLEAARTPHMDRIAACRVGCTRTIPDGLDAGSDVANLSLLGYDPARFHTGRSPFEAASMGVTLGPDEVAFRMNLVTLDRKDDGRIIMVSHSSGDITTSESEPVVRTLKDRLALPDVCVYPGVAYRHLLTWNHGPEHAKTIPPHDMLDRDVAFYLDRGEENPVPGLIRRSWDMLEDHPVNLARRRAGLKEANSIWLWGQGKSPKLPLFKEKYGLSGGVISAVDLLKGIGVYAGFEPIPVEGATGYLDTNYRGKAVGALEALSRMDLVFIHVEAPDEAGHNGNLEEKIQAIEAFDEKVVGTVLTGMDRFEDYRVMVASDHFTPISLKTHSREPAPFAWADARELASAPPGRRFTEKDAASSGLGYEKGYRLMDDFIGLGPITAG